MAIGDAIQQLLGRKDPRQQLLDSIMAQAGPQPAGGVPYADPAAGGGATAAPAGGATQQPDPVPEGLKSPPDLASMYGDLLKYGQRSANIDRGFGLIGSAVSQDANRSDTLRAFTGGSPGADYPTLGNVAELAMSLQKNKALQASRAATLAALPTLAAKYGISVEAARAMFDGGQLEEFIKEQEKPDRTTMTDGEGRLQTIDQRQGAGIGGPIGPAKPVYEAGADGSKYLMVPGQEPKMLIAPSQATNDTKNYDAYVNDEITRGTEPVQILSFNDWNLQQNKSKTTPAANSFAGQMGIDFAKDYQGIRASAKNAQDLMGQYDLVQKALDAGLETGATADAVNSARKIGLAMGLDVDEKKIQGAELIKSVANQMALTMRNPESGMGMPGSLSDKDISFLKQANVGIDTTTGGNRLLIDTYKRVQQRRIEISKLANAYVKKHGQLDAEFADTVTAFNEANPMFEDMEIPGSDKDKPDKVQSLVDKYRKK